MVYTRIGARRTASLLGGPHHFQAAAKCDLYQRTRRDDFSSSLGGGAATILAGAGNDNRVLGGCG